MKTNWEIKKLEDICKLQLGKTPYRKDKRFWDKEKITNNVWLSISDLKHGEYISDSSEYITDIGTRGVVKIPKGTMLISFKLTLGRISFAGKDLYTNEAIVALLDLNKEVLKEYLFYYFSFFDWEKSAEGDIKVKGKTLNKEKLRAIKIPLPPLAEQKRIVSILDEAFVGIEKAKANAEQNLKNAKELFESYLNSIKAEKVDLGELVDIKTGKLNSNAAVENGKYPFFTCSREVYAIDNYAFDLEAILLAGNNASGDFNVKHYKGKFNAYQRTYVITVNEKKKVLYRYLYFQLLKSLKEFKEMSVGANTKFLKLGMIQRLKIALPSIEQQQTIVRQLDALRAETQKLEELYGKKIADCEELKKSILHKAFNGELSTPN